MGHSKYANETWLLGLLRDLPYIQRADEAGWRDGVGSSRFVEEAAEAGRRIPDMPRRLAWLCSRPDVGQSADGSQLCGVTGRVGSVNRSAPGSV